MNHPRVPLGSGVAPAVALVTAVARVRSMAQEHPHAADVAPSAPQKILKSWHMNRSTKGTHF